MEEKWETWKESNLPWWHQTSFCKASISPLLNIKMYVGRWVEGRASPTLGNCLLHFQCKFIEMLTWSITMLNTHAQMFPTLVDSPMSLIIPWRYAQIGLKNTEECCWVSFYSNHFPLDFQWEKEIWLWEKKHFWEIKHFWSYGQNLSWGNAITV